MTAKMNYATIDNLVDASFEEAIQDCLSKLANNEFTFYARFSPDFHPLKVPRVLAVYQIKDYDEDNWKIISSDSIDYDEVLKFNSTERLCVYILECLEDRKKASNHGTAH